jgi:hypothetical protein
MILSSCADRIKDDGCAGVLSNLIDWKLFSLGLTQLNEGDGGVVGGGGGGAPPPPPPPPHTPKLP